MSFKRISFPIYEKFNNQNTAYGDIITKFDCAIITIGSFKTATIKDNASETIQNISIKKLHVDEEIYRGL